MDLELLDGFQYNIERLVQWLARWINNPTVGVRTPTTPVVFVSGKQIFIGILSSPFCKMGTQL